MSAPSTFGAIQLALWLGIVLGLQVPSATQPQVFRASIETVRVDASVTRGGAPVGGLTASNFTVLDNGVEQHLEIAIVERLPLDVQLVLDTSASVSGDRLTHLIGASRGLVAALRPGDRAGLITFSNQVHVLRGLTSDGNALLSPLDGLKAAGDTALRDAVQLALALRGSGERRQLLLVFSDGVDNASWISDEELLDSARRSGTVVHVVRVPDRFDSPSTLLDTLTVATGGRVWQAGSTRDLATLFTKALDDMRSRYLLTFSPQDHAPGWHQLKVKLKGTGGEVMARSGYFVQP